MASSFSATGLNQLCVECLRFFLEFGGNLFHFVLGAQGHRASKWPHVDQVNDAFKTASCPMGIE